MTVRDPCGVPLKVPAWMLEPGATRTLADTAAVGSRALLELCHLLPKPYSPHQAPGLGPEGKTPGNALSDLILLPYAEAKDRVVRDFQRTYLKSVLAECAGDEACAAERMGLSRFGLQKLLKQLGERS